MTTPWQKADKGRVHSLVLEQVQQVERLQFDQFNRFERLATLYDPNRPGSEEQADALGYVTENVIASNVDTVQAAIATNEIRARFMTDDGDWSQQRQARHLEWYADGLCKLHDVDAKCAVAFGKGAAVRGTGVVYVDIKGGKLVVEHVLADDIIVDNRELRGGGRIRQIHRRRIVDKDDLIAEYPKHEQAILAGYNARSGLWAGYRPLGENQVVVLHSWFLGKKGRCTVTLEGVDLEDKPYDSETPPFARIVWSERDESWYGISLAERIMGHQRVLNRSNWQIDRLVDRNAVPTTYVRQADAGLAVKQVNRLGTIAVIRGEVPQTVIAPAISPEVYRRQETVKASASEESGLTRMATHGAKPAGLDSGIALREFRDQTTQRFATQEKAYERFKLDVVLLMLACCKKLGDKAPKVVRKSRFGKRELKWSDVDMGEVRVQIAAASNLSKTPAGRTQLVLELAQGGIISQDSARRLLKHPDAERELSLYTAALENIERVFDDIADGEVRVPEPYMHMAMCVWRGQQQYLIWRDDGAPEEVLEALRDFIVLAADAVAKSEEAAMPQGPAPTAALAPEAMNLVAG